MPLRFESSDEATTVLESYEVTSRLSDAVLNLDGCERLFSLHLFRTLPVGYIPGCILGCVPSLFLPSFLFDCETQCVNLMLREIFALLFQTFSRNDPLGKAPPSRGGAVL